MDRKIILFELNEVPMRIVDRFAAWRPASRLARALPVLHRHVTVAEDETGLTPWKTWPSLHRGVADTRHRILDFGQDLTEVDREFPPLWQLLASRGIRAAVCGSLHTYPLPSDLEHYAFYLPDTFAAGSECFPTRLSALQELNLTMARASARNVSAGVPWGQALALLRKAPGLGLRLSTLSDTARQLVSERIAGWRRIRRRTYQAVLAFDVFMAQLSRTRPDFATFFTNHVASSMHRYWAATFPHDYEEVGFDDRWMHRYRGEIEFTMARFDRFLGRLMRFVDRHPAYQLWIATSMGQEATTAEPVETQLYVGDPDRFMARLGVPAGRWERRPAMLPEVNVRVEPDALGAFLGQLDALRIEGRPLEYRVGSGGLVSMEFGQVNLTGGRSHVVLGPDPLPFAELGLVNLRIDDRSTACAYHVPEGCLLVYDPRDRRPRPPGPTVSALDVAPALLRNFGVTPPSYMRRGTGLG